MEDLMDMMKVMEASEKNGMSPEEMKDHGQPRTRQQILQHHQSKIDQAASVLSSNLL